MTILKFIKIYNQICRKVKQISFKRIFSRLVIENQLGFNRNNNNRIYNNYKDKNFNKSKKSSKLI